MNHKNSAGACAVIWKEDVPYSVLSFMFPDPLHPVSVSHLTNKTDQSLHIPLLCHAVE